MHLLWTAMYILGIVVYTAGRSWRGLWHGVSNAVRLIRLLKPDVVRAAKARMCAGWLTFASSSDDNASKTGTLRAAAREDSGSQSAITPRQPKGKKEFNSWRSLGKPDGLRSTIGELVKPIEYPGPVISGSWVELPVEAVERVEVPEPVDAVIVVSETAQTGRKEGNEGPVLCFKSAPVLTFPETKPKHTKEVLPDATPEPSYTEQTYWGTREEDTPTKPQPTAKVRHSSIDNTPPPSSPKAILLETSIQTPPPAPAAKIPVSPKTLATLTTLLTSLPQHKQTLHFNDDIIPALNDLGFTAKRGGQCSGSAVTFKHRGGGSIVFHRPHPDPRIGVHKQRTWGKRLQDKFGWELEMFVLREG